MGKGQSNNQSEGHSCTLILPEDHTWGGLLLFQHEGLSEGAISHLITAALRDRLIPFNGFFSLKSDGELWLLCQRTHTGCGAVWSYHFIVHDCYVRLYIHICESEPDQSMSLLLTSTLSSHHFHDIDQTWPINCFTTALLTSGNSECVTHNTVQKQLLLALITIYFVYYFVQWYMHTANHSWSATKKKMRHFSF